MDTFKYFLFSPMFGSTFPVILIGGIILAFIVLLMVGQSLIEDVKCRNVSMLYFDAFMLVYSLMSLILFVILLCS